jgi:hypothetical protein
MAIMEIILNLTKEEAIELLSELVLDKFGRYEVDELNIKVIIDDH